MIRRPPRSTRTDTPLSLHDALPILPCARIRSACSSTPSTGQRSLANDPPTARAAPVHHAFGCLCGQRFNPRSEEHTSELQSLMRISYAVFCLKKKIKQTNITHYTISHTTNKHNTIHSKE